MVENSKVWGLGMLRAIKISFRNWRRGPITVQYPFERLEEFSNARWEVEMKLDDEGHHKCTACMACVKACSHHCIEIDVAVAEDRSKTIQNWRYELGACINCGLCVEACPFDAIKMNHDYELAEFTREELLQNLIINEPAAKPKRPDRPAAAAKPANASPAAAKPAIPELEKSIPEIKKTDDAKPDEMKGEGE